MKVLLSRRCPSCGNRHHRRSRSRPPLPLFLVGFRLVRCVRCYSHFLRHFLLDDSSEPEGAPGAEPSHVPNRRQAHRFPVRVPATIELPGVGRSQDTVRPPTVLEGSTRDISIKGVSVVLPRSENERQLAAQSRQPLRIKLHFPDREINLSARAVRFAEEGDDEPTALCVVGAYIIEVEGGFSRLFNGIIRRAPERRAADA
jgi:hypothetical protein